MNDLKVSTMTIDDLENISKFLTSDFDDFWTYSILKSEFENPNSKCFSLKDCTDIIGFACIWQPIDEVHITNIAIRKNLRNNGLGSFLLEYIINLYINTSITLEVNTNNIPAIKLYEKYNFKNVGLRKKYYNGADDAFIMTREVTNEKK